VLSSIVYQRVPGTSPQSHEASKFHKVIFVWLSVFEALWLYYWQTTNGDRTVIGHPLKRWSEVQKQIRPAVI